MIAKRIFVIKSVTIIFLSTVIFACAAPPDKNRRNPEQESKDFAKGTYGYDVAFFARNRIATAELKDTVTGARVLLVPGYQGRVMTSSAKGYKGRSFGWINYQLIGSGEIKKQFNPYGGEERLWLGPEGGPFSIYFPEGKEQVFGNWSVPPQLDTEPFVTVKKSTAGITFRKEFELINASGTRMQAGVERSIRLLSRKEADEALGSLLDTSLGLVTYESENVLVNRGTTPWTEKSGFLSIWLLSMFNPSEQGVVFIPVKQGNAADLSKMVTTDYFGAIPSDRLISKKGILFFKVDGKYRSKIGISPSGALPFCGSYDPENKVLTLLWFSKPDTKERYVNSKWGIQNDPLAGDVVNSYNDGPVADGSIMGPFYEIETSSPAALLRPGEKIIHVQRVFHITGDEEYLDIITRKIFNVPLSEISQAFK